MLDYEHIETSAERLDMNLSAGEQLDMSLRPELRPTGSSTCLKAEWSEYLNRSCSRKYLIYLRIEALRVVTEKIELRGFAPAGILE